MNPIIVGAATNLVVSFIVQLIDELLKNENLILASEPYLAKWHLERDAILTIEGDDDNIHIKLKIPGAVNIVTTRSRKSLSLDLRWVEEAIGQVRALLMPDTLEEQTDEQVELIASLEAQIEDYEALVRRGHKDAPARLESLNKALAHAKNQPDG